MWGLLLGRAGARCGFPGAMGRTGPLRHGGRLFEVDARRRAVLKVTIILLM
jgi:hypothetical protein